MGRILYECRDISFPTGGMRRIYRHVEILANSGFDARVLHHEHTFTNTWFGSSAPVDYWESNYAFASDDVLVIPEGHVDVMRRSATLPCRTVVIALNWGNIYKNLRLGEDWRAFGIKNVIAGSNYEREFIKATMGLESVVIASGIDTNLFVPVTPKDCIIACMPRKNSDYLHLILAGFRSKCPELKRVPIVSIDMRPHADVARIFARSAIFLAHTFPEGLSRKTLEAMACGNVVVGFAGHGSLECMEHLVNCYLVPDGDVLLAIDYLHTAIETFIVGESLPMQAAAVETAKKYSLEAEARNVLGFWTTFVGSSK